MSIVIDGGPARVKARGGGIYGDKLFFGPAESIVEVERLGHILLKPLFVTKESEHGGYRTQHNKDNYPKIKAVAEYWGVGGIHPKS